MMVMWLNEDKIFSRNLIPCSDGQFLIRLGDHVIMSLNMIIKKVFISVIIVLLLLYDVQAECDSSKSKSMLLKELLLNGYEKFERPTNTENGKTQVFLMMFPIYIEFDDSNDHIQLSTYIFMSWADINLKWSTKDDYKDIEYISLEADKIWTPDYRVYNAKVIDDNFDLDDKPILVIKNVGAVYYRKLGKLPAHCVADWTNWPFDKHVCNITITSKKYLGNEMELSHGNIKLEMTRYVPSNEWELIGYESLKTKEFFSESNDTESEFELFLTVRFTIQRHSWVLAVSYICPAIALIVFSFGLLSIESKQSERIIIISFMLTLQTLLLQYLAIKIPSNGDKNPKIVNFFEANLYITALLLLETLIEGSLTTSTSNPLWMKNILNKIDSDKVLKAILLPKEGLKKPTEISDSERAESESFLPPDEENGHLCNVYVTVLNRLSFVILVILHLLVMLICFVF